MFSGSETNHVYLSSFPTNLSYCWALVVAKKSIVGNSLRAQRTREREKSIHRQYKERKDSFP